MKTNVKKILMVLPVLIVLISSLIVPLYSFGADVPTFNGCFNSEINSQSEALSLASKCTESLVFPDPISYYNPSSSTRYFAFTGLIDYKNKSDYGAYAFSCYIPFVEKSSNNDSYYDYDVSVDDEYIIITSESGLDLYVDSSLNRYSGDISSPNTWLSKFGFCDCIKININTNAISFYYSSGSEVGSPNVREGGTLYTYDWTEQGLDLPNFNGLNVEVSFTPSLSGSIDRNLIVDGQSYKSDGFTMKVKNNSRKAIQYRMFIRPVGVSSSDITSEAYENHLSLMEATYNGTDINSFIFYKSEWVYDSDIDSYDSVCDKSGTKKFYKSSDWHYVTSGGEIEQKFNWSQINIEAGVDYQVTVIACLTDYDIASLKISRTANSNGIDVFAGLTLADNKIISSADVETVYTSEFSVTDLSDVPYDPTDSSNGVNPWSSSSDTRNYDLSYDAKQDTADSAIDYTGKNVYNDSSSWYTERVNNSSSFSDRTFSGSSISSEALGGLSSIMSQFFLFFSGVFSFLPSDLYYLILLGIIAVVIVGIFRAVIK